MGKQRQHRRAAAKRRRSADLIRRKSIPLGPWRPLQYSNNAENPVLRLVCIATWTCLCDCTIEATGADLSRTAVLRCSNCGTMWRYRRVRPEPTGGEVQPVLLNGLDENEPAEVIVRSPGNAPAAHLRGVGYGLVRVGELGLFVRRGTEWTIVSSTRFDVVEGSPGMAEFRRRSEFPRGPDRRSRLN